MAAQVLFGNLINNRAMTFMKACIIPRWRSGAVVRGSDFVPRGPWFETRPVHISLWPGEQVTFTLLSSG